VSACEVLLLMGSSSDWPAVRPAVEVLQELGVAVEAHVASAHRSPERTLQLVEEAEARGCRVFLCAAGMAAHLAGAVAAHTLRPVIGIPLPGGVLDGIDALLSTVQMPPGIPVATVTVGPAGARNAAFLAAEIVAIERPEVAAALRRQRIAGERRIAAADAEIQAELGEPQ